ncbi:cyclophilin-like fold protein [uncultured Draconibacterium sp.]|uniref:cyclophilin-like fold protein n=1 Tax=uncultured Draconibacterium sp. TaxID=1573823 RepID=UPI002AA886C8|nr:cyclophilin-like fold protein [uncultured Draconibacterium sp.]
MKIRIHSKNTVLTATLNESKTAINFAALLPVNLNLDDYGQSSKISKLAQRLDVTDADDGFAPKAGDIIYFAPLGNIAIFYEDVKYSSGLIKIGELDGNAKALKAIENIKARIDLTEQDAYNVLSMLKNKELQEDE